MVRAILSNPNVKVVPQTHAAFLNALAFYEQREDKEYTLTDCISMNAMRSESLTEVLTRPFSHKLYPIFAVTEPSGSVLGSDGGESFPDSRFEGF